jgi:hypothetical protein
MVRNPVQFGLSSLVLLVLFAALNCWLFKFGAWGGVLAVVVDKHVLVAYLCMKADVDRRSTASSTDVSRGAARGPGGPAADQL